MPTPEGLARENIDKQLESCGWTVQSRVEMNLYARRGLSVVGEVPCEDDIESAAEVGLVRAGRLRHIVPVGEAVLRSTFEGRL